MESTIPILHTVFGFVASYLIYFMIFGFALAVFLEF